MNTCETHIHTCKKINTREKKTHVKKKKKRLDLNLNEKKN